MYAEYQASILPNDLWIWANKKTFCQQELAALLSKKLPSEFLQQTSWWLKTAFSFFLFFQWVSISVQLCRITANVLHWFGGLLEDVCALSVLPVFPATLPSSVFTGCQGHARGPWGHVCSCRFPCARQICEPTRTAHEALWQLGSSPSVAAHCSLRQRYYGRPPAATHCDTSGGTYAHAHTKSSIPSGPFLRCCPTRPQQGSPALQGKEEGKKNLMSHFVSIKAAVFYEAWQLWQHDVFFITHCCLFLLFLVLPALSSSVCKTGCSSGGTGVKISLASFAHLNQADGVKNTKECVFLKAGFH